VFRCSVRLCSVVPSPAGIQAETRWIDRDWIDREFVPPIFHDVFGYTRPGSVPVPIPPNPAESTGVKNISSLPVYSIPNGYSRKNAIKRETKPLSRSHLQRLRRRRPTQGTATAPGGAASDADALAGLQGLVVGMDAGQIQG
jgi:hypothetical protein